MKYQIAKAHLRMLGYKPMFEHTASERILYASGKIMIGFDESQEEWYTLYISDCQQSRDLVKVLNAKPNSSSPS